MGHDLLEGEQTDTGVGAGVGRVAGEELGGEQDRRGGGDRGAVALADESETPLEGRAGGTPAAHSDDEGASLGAKGCEE